MRPGFRACLGCLGILLLVPLLFRPAAVVGQSTGSTPLFLPLVMNRVAGDAAGMVANGDFEQGRTGWDEYSLLQYNIITEREELFLPEGTSPYSGDWVAWLGGADAEVSYIEQDVTVTADQPVLSYWYLIDSYDEQCGSDFGRVEVDDEDATTVVVEYELCESQNTDDWVQETVDLSAYVGETVTLRFSGITDEVELTDSSFYIDDVSFQAEP